MSVEVLSNEARKQLINTKQLFDAYQATFLRTSSLSGSMSYASVKGNSYLYRDRVIAGKKVRRSLGRRSPETDAILEQFKAAQSDHADRVASLTRQLTLQSFTNRGQALGQMPRQVAAILRALNRAGAMGAGGNCTVLGTNALYAYESLLSCRFSADILATGDVDFLVDTRRVLHLAVAENGERETLERVIRSADKTMERHPRRNYALVNDRGFAVEFIAPVRSPPWRPERHPLAEEDIKPAEIEQLRWLLNAPKVREVAVSEDGSPVAMTTIEPLAFAAYKAWMSQQRQRAPEKRTRDAAQADSIVEAMIRSGFADGIDLKVVTAMPKEAAECASYLVDIAERVRREQAASLGF